MPRIKSEIKVFSDAVLKANPEFTVSEALEYLPNTMHRNTLINKINDGELKGRKEGEGHGARYFVSAVAIQDYVSRLFE